MSRWRPAVDPGPARHRPRDHHLTLSVVSVVGDPQGRLCAVTDTTYAFELDGLTKRFGDEIAVDDLSLTVPKGSFFGMLGPNGAGKTTSLSMAVGLLRPDAGTARDLRRRRLGRADRGEGAGRRAAGRARDAGAADRAGGAAVPRPAARAAGAGGPRPHGRAAGGARAGRHRRQAGGRLLDRNAEEARAGDRAAARAAAAGTGRAVRGGRPGVGGNDPHHSEPVRRERRLGGACRAT